MMANKFIRLEAARGIAAIVVLLHHFFLAFQPELLGTLAENRTAGSLAGSWYYIFFNGSAAVTFFFVLSGYVLAIKPLSTNSITVVIDSALRRWPRLIPLVLISTISSYFIYKNELYYFHQAAEISRTAWHSTWNLDAIKPSLLDAFIQGSFLVFFSGENYLNTNLWTLEQEIIGSAYIYIACAAYITKSKFPSKKTKILFLLIILIGLLKTLIPFLLGFLIALNQKYLINILKISAFRLLAGAASLYLLGFLTPTNHYAWIALLGTEPQYIINKIIHPLGGALLMLILISNKKSFLDGRFGRVLGELSFPLYISHTIIIWSLSSFLFIKNPTFMIINFSLTFFIVLAASYILAKIDLKWVEFLKSRISLAKIKEYLHR